MPMRVYVIGNEGQVARSLREAAQFDDDITVECSSRPAVDVLRPNSVERALAAFAPDIVVNPAAYTAVDRAESEAELAVSINRDGAACVAMATKRMDIPLIHLSTDYVFDGKKEGRYVETDPVAPKSVYGRSKLEGEVAVSNANPRSIILRTSWVYAPFGTNFVRTMIRLAAERDRLRVVNDQIGCPTYAPDIALAIISIAKAIGSSGWKPDFAGVTHIAGPEDVTWYAFARNIMDLLKARDHRVSEIDAISTAEYPTAAYRPTNSRLDCARLSSVFNLRLPALSRSLEACVDKIFDSSNNMRSRP
jgi:dTDP-4-dehydrorhamnose reductase